MKKILAILLAGMMTATALVGCGGGRCCQHKSTLHVRHLCQAEPWRRAGDHLRPYVRLGRGHRRRRPCQAGPAHRLCGPNGPRIWIPPAFRGEPERRARGRSRLSGVARSFGPAATRRKEQRPARPGNVRPLFLYAEKAVQGNG